MSKKESFSNLTNKENRKSKKDASFKNWNKRLKRKLKREVLQIYYN